MKRLLLFFINLTLLNQAIAGGKELSFGLTKKQKEQIAVLTKNQIDFRHIYLTSIDLSSKNIPPHIFRDYDPDTTNDNWQSSLKVQEAWKYATGKGVTIADCDAGFLIDEDELTPNLLLNHARDFSNTDDPQTINDGNFLHHGTASAAIMVGLLNGSGINGISPDAKLVPLQNYNYDWGLDKKNKEEATTECILHALKIPQVNIILLENQTHGSSETFVGTREAVKLALKSGVIIISAAGNSGNQLLTEEKYDTGSIIVGAVNQKGHKESISNFGKRVSVSAYGDGILTLMFRNGTTSYFAGTSAAAPQVASTVALMLETNPQLTPEQVKDILVSTRKTIKENQTVGGLLNLLEAVKKAKSINADRQTHEEQKKFRTDLLSILKS